MGQGYAQAKDTKTNGPVADAALPDVQNQQQLQGNAAIQEQVQAPTDTGLAVHGPLGRMWNHILGKPEGTQTTTATVTRSEVRAYLDRIGLADGEFFRGKKLDGVADSLLQKYDLDHDARLTWTEFLGFGKELAGMLVGPAGPEAEQKTTDTSKDGQASMEEIRTRTAARLPAKTQHKDLVAQLGARALLDAADTNEQEKPVAQRTLSTGEWTTAAKELGGAKK